MEIMENWQHMPPRLRRVALVLATDSRVPKELAPELGVTVATLHLYSDMIYKALGINSRLELMLGYWQTLCEVCGSGRVE